MINNTNMDSRNTEDKTIHYISQEDFIKFLKEKHIEIDGNDPESLFESFVVFQKFMSLMFKSKSFYPYYSDKRKATSEQHSCDKDQINIFNHSDEVNLAKENLDQLHNNTIEDINAHIVHNNNKEEDNAYGKMSNQMTVESQNEVKNNEDNTDKEKENSKKPQYVNYDDIPIKPATIDFIELVEKNLAELQYQPEPKKIEEHSKEKRITHRSNVRHIQNKKRSKTVKGEDKVEMEKDKNSDSHANKKSKRQKRQKDNTINKDKFKVNNNNEEEKQISKSQLKQVKNRQIPNKNEQSKNQIKDKEEKKEDIGKKTLPVSKQKQNIKTEEEKSQIKQNNRIEAAEEEKPHVLPPTITDNSFKEEGEEKDDNNIPKEEEDILSNIKHIDQQKEKIMPSIKKEEQCNPEVNVDKANDDDDNYDVDELLPEEKHIKKHIDDIDLSQSDSFNIILPEYENYESIETGNKNKNKDTNNNKNMNIIKNTHKSESDDDEIIINCDSFGDEEEEDTNKNDENNNNLKNEIEIMPLSNKEEAIKVIEPNIDQGKEIQHLPIKAKEAIVISSEIQQNEFAAIPNIEIKDKPKLQYGKRPLSFSNITPPIQRKFINQSPSTQNKKDKEQIDQLQAKINKLKEDCNQKASKSKIAIETLKKQLHDANTRIAEYSRSTKGNHLSKLNTAPYNHPRKDNNTNSIDKQQHNHTNPYSKRNIIKTSTSQSKKNSNKKIPKKKTNLKVFKVEDLDETYDLQFPSKYDLKPEDIVVFKENTIDGKTIKVYSNRMKEIIFASGTIKKIYEDGYQIINFTNDDIKQIYPNGKSVYYYAEAKVTQTILPNNLHIYKLANGRIEKHYPNGNKEISK